MVLEFQSRKHLLISVARGELCVNGEWYKQTQDSDTRIPIIIKRTSVQKSRARVKNSNCLNFCTQVDPSKTRKVKYFFPQICFYFREKRTFRFHPLESMDRVITGRKLNTFARFAFQRYFIKGNLNNACSFIDSSSSVKCKLCRSWLPRSF